MKEEGSLKYSGSSFHRYTESGEIRERYNNGVYEKFNLNGKLDLSFKQQPLLNYHY